MIFFDCERLKHPYTGLYHYTLNLANALALEARKAGDIDLGFYVHKYRQDLLDCDTYKKIVGHFDRALLYDRKIKLWHTSSQLSRYQPLTGKKIMTIHDLNFLYEPIGENKKKHIVNIIKKNLRRCSALIAISNFTKNDILQYFDIGSMPVEVIYNGCNKYSGPITRPSRYSGRDFLFSVGAVVPKKNFHVLPCLLKDNDFDLIIAGIIESEDYRRHIIDEARRYGVENRVIITGAIEESEKHWYMKNCKAFLLPSIAEGFGLPVIEAMQYGKPVFLSDHTSLPEIGGEYAFYFNHQFDEEQMLEVFNKSMADFYSGNKSAEEIIKHAEQFSWSNAAQRHMDLYRRLLS